PRRRRSSGPPLLSDALLGTPARPLLGWGRHAPAPPTGTGGRAASLTTTTSTATTTPDAAPREECRYSRNAPLGHVTRHGLRSHDPGPMALPPPPLQSLAAPCSPSPTP